MSMDNRRARLGSWVDAYEDAILAADDSEFEGMPQLDAVARAVKEQVEAAVSVVTKSTPKSTLKVVSTRRRRAAGGGKGRAPVPVPRPQRQAPLRACFSAVKTPTKDEDESE